MCALGEVFLSLPKLAHQIDHANVDIQLAAPFQSVFSRLSDGMVRAGACHSFSYLR